MEAWVTRLSARFNAQVAQLYFVRDADNLLGVAELRSALQAQGFSIAPYGDSIEFRYRFEQELRPALYGADEARIIVDIGERVHHTIPFDLLSDGKVVELGLGEIVPKLSAIALSDVPREDLGRVVDAHARFQGETLGEGATREFLLREVYGISIATLARRDMFVEYLLRRHYSHEVLPESLDLLLATQLAPALGLDHDIFALLRQPEAFYAWLQESWGGYVRQRSQRLISEERTPFDRPGVRVYLDNLFADGLLRRVAAEADDIPGWMRPGVALPGDDPSAEYQEMIEQLDGAWPRDDAPHQDWLAFAWRWALLRARIGSLADSGTDKGVIADMVAAMHRLQEPLERAFELWMYRRYAGLATLAATTKPIMVHQIAGAVRRGLEQGERIALIVMDGMALDHWLAVRAQLAAMNSRWTSEEGACFAWVPTLTSISRQAIFAGRIPQFFPDSWTTTSHEAAHWQRLGTDWGLPTPAAQYASLRLRTMALGADPLAGLPVVDDHRVQLLGLVVIDIDELAHATKLGMIEMQRDVRHWASRGHLGRLIDGLLNRDFTLYITADHGSVEAIGGGQPREGVLVDQRALRARVYSEATFANRVYAETPAAQHWTSVGLPEKLYVLVPKGLTAFAPAGESVVAHGGIALEEVIVPFIRIRGR